MQNIVTESDDFPEGKQWREAFQTKGSKVFVAADYGSQEMRVLADKANEESMIRALTNNEDLHSLTASKMYNKEVSKTVNSALRKNGKIVNFLIPYGGGADKLANQFGIPIREAQKILDLYFNGYPNVKKLFDKVIKDTFKNGYITIDSLGRRSYVDKFNTYKWLDDKIKYWRSINFDIPKEFIKTYLTLKGEIERTSQNYIIQGEAASITKLAGVLLRRERLKNPIFEIVLMIHDEIILECDSMYAEEVKVLLERCMLDAASFFCKKLPIPADSIITTKWNK